MHYRVIVHYTYRSSETFEYVKAYYNMGAELVLEWAEGNLKRIPRSTIASYDVLAQPEERPCFGDRN